MWFRRLRCSFCNRSDKEVTKLVAGASGYICDTCAHEAVRIMETAPPGGTSPVTREALLKERASDWNRTWLFVTTAAEAQWTMPGPTGPAYTERPTIED